MTTWATTSRASQTSSSLTGETPLPRSPMPSTKPSFDPSAPLLGEDGLEYEDFGDWLCRKPAQCQRNTHIQRFRAEGRNEEAVRVWIGGYDRGASRFAFEDERAAWCRGKVGPIIKRRVQAVTAVVDRFATATAEGDPAGLRALVDPAADPTAAAYNAGW